MLFYKKVSYIFVEPFGFGALGGEMPFCQLDKMFFSNLYQWLSFYNKRPFFLTGTLQLSALKGIHLIALFYLPEADRATHSTYLWVSLICEPCTSVHQFRPVIQSRIKSLTLLCLPSLPDTHHSRFCPMSRSHITHFLPIEGGTHLLLWWLRWRLMTKRFFWQKKGRRK